MDDDSVNDDVINIPDAVIQQENQNNNTNQDKEIISKEEKTPISENNASGVAQTTRIEPKKWLKSINWSKNPFTFSISPALFVGYNNQKNSILSALEESHKINMVVGPTGSGKTTLLTWISRNMPDFDFMYIGKPPSQPDGFVEIFNNKFKAPWFLRWFIPNIKNIYEIPEFLNKKLKNRQLIILFDEAHESNLDILEWLRVLSDQINNMYLIVAGLPVFDDVLSKIETFKKRIAVRIELVSLTKEETRELIRKRIMSVGGSGSEFSDDMINNIFERTGGFPREVLRLCNDIINNSIENGRFVFDFDAKTKIEERKDVVSLNMLDTMTPMQKHVIEALKKPMTPGDIANTLDLDKYKSRQHAVRSVNNILKMLMKENFVERRRNDRAFVYYLAPKIKTLVIKA